MAEKEYIEREAALKILENSLTFCKRELYKGSFRQGCIAATQDDIGNIKHIPAADVAPRAEVAREIFEEIEELFHILVGNETGKEFYSLVASEYAEFKKKYTGGEDTNVPAKKDYYTPEEVRNMSPTEISNNLTVIRESMKRWREE